MSWTRYAARARSSRRGFLRGAGLGAAGLFLSPIFRRLHAEAQGAAAPKRLVIIIEGNGFYGFSRWDRLTMDAPRETAVTDMASELPMVASWAPWRDRVVALHGLANKQGAGQGAGHRAHYYALSCLPYANGSQPGGPSIDAVLGRTLPSDDVVFPVVRLGADEGGRGLVPFNCSTARGTTVASQFDPRAAWLELFGAGAPDAEDRAAFAQQGLLLDSVHRYASSAGARLGGDERWKLDRYLYSIETFERRQAALVARTEQLMACAPDAPGAMEGTGLRTALQFNNAAAALICGLTNVVVLSIGPGLTTFADWGFGGRHSMGHGGGATEHRPGGIAGLIENHDMIANEAASLVTQLEAVPEGDGTMLDNTAVVFINDNGEQHHAKYDTFPVVMLGDFGGRLRSGGRLVEYPNWKQTGARGLAELWRTVAHAMGATGPEIDGFAAGNIGPNDDLLPELL